MNKQPHKILVIEENPVLRKNSSESLSDYYECEALTTSQALEDDLTVYDLVIVQIHGDYPDGFHEIVSRTGRKNVYAAVWDMDENVGYVFNAGRDGAAGYLRLPLSLIDIGRILR